MRASATRWQLDEIVAECAGPAGKAYRELTRGVLRGLTFGRPALGDRPLQGLVWWAKTAHVLPARPITPELAAFWRMLNRACVGLIGEEYPVFAGDPRAAARVGASGQQRLARGLGGNMHRLSRAEAQRWRAAYLEARAKSGVSGFAFFDFRFENSPPGVVRELLRELARLL